jgi:hypothetical protein
MNEIPYQISLITSKFSETFQIQRMQRKIKKHITYTFFDVLTCWRMNKCAALCSDLPLTLQAYQNQAMLFLKEDI